MKLNLTIENLQSFYLSDQTKNLAYRLKNLKRLLKSLKENEESILKALNEDLHISIEEAYITEIGIIYRELELFIKNLRHWQKPKKLNVSFFNQLAKSYYTYEPYGLSLIVNNSNHCFLNTFSPVIASIASGNVCLIKINSIALRTNAIIKRILSEIYIENYLYVCDENINFSDFSTYKYDHIYYNGNKEIGNLFIKNSKENLTPGIFEFTRKNPCIIDKICDVEKACKKIVWGKTLLAGQGQYAIDYLMVNKYNKAEIIKLLKKYIKEFYADSLNNEAYPKIVNEKNFNRLVKLLYDGKILHGGKYHSYYGKIEPTIIENVSLNSFLQKEEICGPILPIIEYDTISEAIRTINEKEKPSVTYFFSNDSKAITDFSKNIKTVMLSINETVMPFIDEFNPNKGESNFYNFSVKKHIFHKRLYKLQDLRYPPYQGKINKIKKSMK